MQTQILYAEPVVGLAALGVIKLSIVCFYKRIFTTRAFGITCNAFLALIICWTIGALVVSATFTTAKLLISVEVD